MSTYGMHKRAVVVDTRAPAPPIADIPRRPMPSHLPDQSNTPLASLDEWDDFLKERYPEPAPAPAAEKRKPAVGVSAEKKKEEFRAYEADARPSVREFYRLNHTY